MISFFRTSHIGTFCHSHRASCRRTWLQKSRATAAASRDSAWAGKLRSRIDGRNREWPDDQRYARAARSSSGTRSNFGFRVTDACRSRQAAFSAGEIIATIDNTALTDAVTSAKNAVTNAESSVALTKREQQRQETLLKSGAISEQSVDQSRQNAVSAEAGLAQAKSLLATAEKQLGYATVRAPFSGVVSEKSASIGDVVQQGTALYTIVDPTTLELQGTVPANALDIVRIGLQVAFDVTGYPDRNFVGTIARINPTADPTTRQVRIYAEIPNKGKSLRRWTLCRGSNRQHFEDDAYASGGRNRS